MIQTNAGRRQPDVIRINQEAKAMSQSQVSPKLALLNQVWEKLKQSILKKQAQLEEALREVSYHYKFICCCITLSFCSYTHFVLPIGSELLHSVR